ncbi:DUF3253 domain-containing protein [Novispirillum itersonii]|uniref:DUF3253 domain-containing protein n=1 Tax=Novispirillum itersonii TaxID=189 RepID=UPI0003665452|nr:DUF3253 domain-containing protein [Novispirillum itersonii]
MTDSVATPSDNGQKADSPKGDPIAHLIVSMAGAAGTVGVSAQDVAKSYFQQHRKAKDPADGWRRYMNPVKQQMTSLARKGTIEIVRGSVVQDPDDFRGLVRMRLPQPGAAEG